MVDLSWNVPHVLIIPPATNPRIFISTSASSASSLRSTFQHHRQQSHVAAHVVGSSCGAQYAETRPLATSVGTDGGSPPRPAVGCGAAAGESRSRAGCQGGARASVGSRHGKLMAAAGMLVISVLLLMAARGEAGAGIVVTR